MKNVEFLCIAKTWISHKFILANKSHWYKAGFKKDAVTHAKAIFTDFVKYKSKYSAGQIAILIKRHETLLEALFPIPSNPSYENSFIIFKKLIQAAEQIINQFNLTV